MNYDERGSGNYPKGVLSSSDLERIREKNDEFMKLTRVFLQQSRKLRELAEIEKSESEK